MNYVPGHFLFQPQHDILNEQLRLLVEWKSSGIPQMIKTTSKVAFAPSDPDGMAAITEAVLEHSRRGGRY